MQPALADLSSIDFAIFNIEGSLIDVPISKPCAARNVFAIPPPIIRWSTFKIRLFSSSSFVDIFEPPIKAVRGSLGLLKIRLRALISVTKEKPAHLGKSLAKASIEL